MFTLKLIKESIKNPYELLDSAYKLSGNKNNVGAESIFIGRMRDFRKEKVSKMYIQHYPKMTEIQLNKIAKSLINKYHLLSLFVAHRYGDIGIDDPIVIISSRAIHRKNATAATEKMLEELKHKAPFWKKEITEKGSNWVDCNTENKIMPKNI